MFPLWHHPHNFDVVLKTSSPRNRVAFTDPATHLSVLPLNRKSDRRRYHQTATSDGKNRGKENQFVRIRSLNALELPESWTFGKVLRGSAQSRVVACQLIEKMGATGIEPMTSIVSRYLGLSILLIRLGSLWSVLVNTARYSALIVPKLFPSFHVQLSRASRINDSITSELL